MADLPEHLGGAGVSVTLRNRVVLITGASSGTGRAAAVAFAREGFGLPSP